MLNEIMEYNQYVSTDFDAFPVKGSGRLKLKHLLPGLKSQSVNSGLKRPLTIIARYYMHDCGFDDDKVRKALNAWRGREKDNSEEIKPLNDWYPKYLNYLAGEDKKVQVQDALKRINAASFGVKTSNSYGNTQNKIIFDDILDDAWCSTGSLKRYYLFSEAGALDDVKFDTVELSLKKEKDRESFSNQILKTVAAYYLNKGTQENVPITLVDICNWFVSPALNKFEISNFYFRNQGEYVRIFENKAEAKNRSWKLYIPPEFRNRFAVVEENGFDEFQKEHPDWIFYSDPGAGYQLRKNVKYSEFEKTSN